MTIEDLIADVDSDIDAEKEKEQEGAQKPAAPASTIESPAPMPEPAAPAPPLSNIAAPAPTLEPSAPTMQPAPAAPAATPAAPTADPTDSLIAELDTEIDSVKKEEKASLFPGVYGATGVGAPSEAKEKSEPKPPEDAVDLLLQMTAGQTPDQYDDLVFQWRDTLSPKQLAKLAQADETFPLLESQQKAAYDYIRKNEDPFQAPQTFDDWYGIAEYVATIVPRVAGQVAESTVGFAKGAYKFGKGIYDYTTAENFAWKDAYETLPDDAKERVREQLGSIPGGFFNPKELSDAEISKIVFAQLPEQQRKQFEQQSQAGTEAGRTAVYSVLDPLVELPYSLAETGMKVATGGTSIWDRITEASGLRSYQDSYENWSNRRLFDGAMRRWKEESPTGYHKYLETITPAIVAISKLDGPTVEDYMREEGLSREEAELARDYDAEQRTLAAINETKEGIPDLDEDIRLFGEFALPAGLGIDQFGYFNQLYRVGAGLTPKLYAKLRLAGKTPDEINQYYTQRANAAKASAKAEFERRSKPSTVGKIAEATANQIDRVQAALDQSAFWKRVRQASPYLAGAAVGYGVTEDPLAFLYGSVGGKLATSFPRFVSDWDNARTRSAGGRQGTFATYSEIIQDRANARRGKPFDPEAKPEIKLKGTIGERIQDFGGAKIDNILDNVGEYIRMGVQPTLVGIGVGAINSSDDEELASIIGNGLVYSIGGRAFQQIKNKALGGYDPVIGRRRLRQDIMDLQKLYRDATPETQKQIDRLSDWNTVIEAKEREVAMAQKRLQEAEGNAAKVAAGDPTRFRSPQDTIAETAAASEKVVAAKKSLELRQATLDRVKTANTQTRNEYSRQWLQNLARLNMLGNGTLREGMNNVGINVLSSAEIYKMMRRNPENASLSNEQLWETATQSGFYNSPDGSTVFKPGSAMNERGAKIVFDSKRPSVVVNADYIRQTAGQTGQLPIFALNHEFGHHLRNVPEYAELIKDAENMLFAQEVKDLSGKTVAVTPGKYSQSDLVDMYWNRYLSGYTKAEKMDFARMNNLVDETTGQLKPEDTAAYMRNEIMADLSAETMSRLVDPQKDGAIKDIYDRALLKFRTKKLAGLVDKLRRLGGTGDVITDNTGAELSPDVMQAATDAMKAYDALKNQVSPAVPQPERPKISRAQMMRDRSLLARYGADSPLFSTSVKAQVFDANGNPIGTSIPIDMKDPSLSEGVWERTETGVKQIGGYGRLSRQIDLAGVPVGSRIVISNQIDFQPDGVTPIVLNPRAAKKRGQDRSQIIRAALDNTPDYGAPNRFQPVSPGSNTYRGTFTPLQIKALMEIPDSVVPKSIKDRILAFNQALARNDGTRMIVDYAAVMTDSGKYQAFSPKIYDVVPIGMMFSKDGNFLATTISVTRLFDKLNAWSERMPARLEYWNGSKDRFWSDFSKMYLANWQKGIKGSGYTKEGKPIEGSIQLDADAEIAQKKANIFNDFLNLFDNATEGLNPDRTQTPRRKGDPRDKDIDRTIMSMRMDHVAEVLENPMGKLPIIYEYAKQNFLPNPKDRGEQAAPRRTIEGDQMPFKVVTQNRNPDLQQAAQRLIRGEIDTAQYQALVRELSPYEDLAEIPEPQSLDQIRETMGGSRQKNVGQVKEKGLKQGDLTESRIDIRAYLNKGEHVNVLHSPTTKEVGGRASEVISYEPTVHLKNVKFMVNPTESLEIAAGRQKGTIARIQGKWQDTAPESAYELANEKFNDPEWIQLGMNPVRQSNFYIRSTGEPVKSADEIIQIGKFVLAKNVKKVTPEEMPERTMTEYGMPFLPRPRRAEEGELKAPALSGVEPPKRFVGPQGTALEGVTVEYVPEARPLEGISFLPKPKTDRYKFAFTVASDRVKLVDDLIKAKDWQGIRDLNQATVRHAMSDLRGINYEIKDVLGAFENGREVSATIEVYTPDPQMLAEVRKRMVALGELWKQTEVLEEKVGMGDEDLLGTVDNDGFLHIAKHELDFDKLTSRMVEKARLAAGIQSMTIDGNKVIFYDTDNIGAGFAERVGAFADSIAEQGGIVRGSSTDNAAVRSYRDPESVKAGSLYYNDDPVRLFGAGQLPDRLRSPVYRVVSELLGRPLPPPKDGKRSYFTKEDVTPKQVKLQNAIGNIQDRVVLNDRKNKDVVRAYEELNNELVKQFDALVAAGMRFEGINDYETYSKTYPNSSAVIKDIRNNNQLMFLKTNPQTFGPLKNGKPMDFSFHPLLQDSGRTDAAGNKLNYNDILRVVHDAIAHGTYAAEFGPIGEESAWHTHIRTIDNPWARWALTMETRAQNSFVNYRDARIGKDKMPLKPGDEGYVPIPDRDYAEQKFALIPLKYALTGDARVDKPVKDLMAEIGDKRAQGSAEKRPDWMPSKAKEKEILSKIPQPAGNPKTLVADATAILGKPTKADEASSVPVIVSKEWMKKKAKTEEGDGEEDAGDSLTVGEAQLKDVVTYEVTGMPIVVRPLPNYAAENNATKVAKDVLKIAERPDQYKEYSDRVVAAGEKVRNDPQRFTTLSGYLEFMRESGASGNLLMPPTQLVELVKNAQHILNLWNGGYHGKKTMPGTIKAAREGLDGVNEMKSLMTENGVNLGPTPMITALHHLWGILSRQLDPLNQEGMWMRLVSNPAVIEQIQRSIDGEYNLTRDQWKAIVQTARRETKGEYAKIGNNATSNANAFALMLERHNGRWDELASIYRLDDPVAMTNAFWGLNVGPTGIKNKVQRFIGLTFGIHGSVLDRWRFVSLNLPMAMKLTGKPIPEAYFKYYGRNKTIPEDPVGIYKSYGTVENGNPVYSTALYTGIDRTIEGLIANSPALRNFLGTHATPGGFHWIDWNCVKNEAVGHSSLDLTKEFLKQKGRDATGEDFLDVVQNSTVYTRADQDGKILDLVMENGVFKLRGD